jgi:hypothetical protein
MNHFTKRRNAYFTHPPPSLLFIIHYINSCMLLSIVQM